MKVIHVLSKEMLAYTSGQSRF